MEVQTNGNQGCEESLSGVSTQVEVKVSTDDGETWTRRMINMASNLNESGLEAGEVVKLQGEKYRVLAGDDGLRIELVKKSAKRR